MKRTKVLVQINSVGIRGSEINSVDLAAALVPHGFDCVLVAPRDTFVPGPSLFDFAAERGVAVELHDRASSVRQGARQLSEMARRHGADLVHVYGSWSSRDAYWGPCLLGRRPLVKTIYEMKVNADTAGVGPELIIGTRQLREAITGRVGGVHLVSPPVDLSRDNIEAVDGNEFMRRWGIDPARLKTVIVSRLDNDLKGASIRYSIMAADRLAASGMQLVIVGGGDSEAIFRDMASDINARHGRKVIIMTGALSDPRGAYACADIVVGMGGSAGRGLAFGKPLVVAGEFGLFRVFRPETAAELFHEGFWSPYRSEDPAAELADALSGLLADEKLRSDLGSFGRDFARKHFGLDEMARRQAEVYRIAMKDYHVRRWMADLPLEAGFLWRRLNGRRGYRPLHLHDPAHRGEAA